MHRPAVRFTLLIGLLILGITTTFLIRDAHVRSGAARTAHDDFDARIDALLADIADLGAAQQGYVIPGQSDEPWLAQASSLFQRLYDATAGVRGLSATPESAAALQTFSTGLDTLLAMDARAREYLRLGQDLMAADLLLDEGRATLTTLNEALFALRAAERARASADSATVVTFNAFLISGMAIAWVIGLGLLVRVPTATAVSVPDESIPAATEPTELPASPPVSALDLSSAAAVCGDIARLTEAETLPSLLARAAAVMHASGLIVWMGAGEELFAVMAHGYDRRMLSRLPPIGRSAENATAAAWREGELRTVAGDMMANGAVVAPMFGPSGCVGVLAIELRNGGEADPAIRAVASIFAAQLGGVVGAWPGASAKSGPEAARA